jgi:hypothetical protein
MIIGPYNGTVVYGYQRSKSVIRDYGKVVQDTIQLDNYTLDIYTATDKQGKKIHKLYYLKDKFDHWIKSKLVFFSNNKKYKTLRSERKEF